MTKLRYVGTHAREFPGPDDKRIMLGPGEFLEDADTENEEIKAATDDGVLIGEQQTEREGFVVEDNTPDSVQPEQSEEGGESS